MKFSDSTSTEAVEVAFGRRIAAARVGASLTQADLAEQAGIAKRTLERLEAGGGCQLSSVFAVLRVLGLLDRLDAVLPDIGPTPMQRLQTERVLGKTPRRVRSARLTSSLSTPVVKKADTAFRWGDE